MSNQSNPNPNPNPTQNEDTNTNTNTNTRVRIPAGYVALSNTVGDEELVSRVADLFSHLAIRDVLGTEVPLPEGMVVSDINITPVVPGLYTTPSTRSGLGSWLRSAPFNVPVYSSRSSSSSSDTDSTNAVIDDTEQAFINRLLNQERTDCVILPTIDNTNDNGDETEDDDDDVTIISDNGIYSESDNNRDNNHGKHNDDKQPMVCDSGISSGNGDGSGVTENVKPLEPISAIHYIMDPSMVDNVIASEFTCAICKLILDSPFEISVCGHTFCGECITKWVNVSVGNQVVKCPECKVELQPNYINPSKKIDRIVKTMNIKCDYCKWSGCIMDYKKHIDQTDKKHRCPRIEVACSKCTKSVASGYLITHFKTECPFRKVPCTKCKKKVLFHSLEKHMKTDCEFAILECNDPCTFKGNQKEYKNHVKECPYTYISCPYEKYGCVEKIMRKNMKSNTSRKDGIAHHLSLMSNHVKKLENRISEVGVISHSSQLQKGQLVLYKCESAEVADILPSGQIELTGEYEDGT